MNHADADLRTRLEKIDDLSALVERLWADAVEAWPDLRVDRDAMLAAWANRMRGDLDPEATLRRLHAADLYLALACEAGDPGAVAAFESQVLPAVDPALRRIAATPDEVAEARQVLLDRLLVGAEPKIRDYAGRGRLKAWLRVAAVRILHNMRRGTRPSAADDALLERVLPHEDPELAAIKASYRAQFRDAFVAAVGTLAAEHRTLLRQHWVDGLASGAIASLHGVHRATASRWLVTAQETLVEATRRELGERLRIGSEEVRSVIRLIQSRFEASVHRMIAED